MYKCTKCNNESKKEHIVCVKCGSVGMYVPFEPAPKQYALKRTPIVKKTTFEVDNELETWFKDRRKELTGVCQNCGGKTCKDDDKFYKFSIAHILVKSRFKSVRTHKDNFIELCFWGNSCHSTMDNKSSELWAQMTCFEEIKRKFGILKPLLLESEIKYLPLIFKNTQS